MPNRLPEQSVIHDYLNDEPLAVIVSRYGCSRSAIHNLLRRKGVTPRPKPSGARHPNWRGGRRLNAYGYVLVWADPEDALAQAMRFKNDAYVLEHRLVVARKLNRPLTSGEQVHHIDGDKTNNDISNLQLVSSHPNGVCLICGECGSDNIIQKELND